MTWSQTCACWTTAIYKTLKTMKIKINEDRFNKLLIMNLKNELKQYKEEK